MTLSDLLKKLRRRLNDKALPYLWDDAELTEYLNEAVDEAADRARLIYDETSSLTQFDVTADQAFYPLNNRVLDVDRVKLNGHLLRRKTKMQLDNGEFSGYARGRYETYANPHHGMSSAVTWENDTGTPWAFIEEVNSIQLYPKPVVSGKLTLSLWRLPLEPLVGPDDEPEIPAQHHPRLIEWALHLCYLNRDSDAEDQVRAEKYAADFEQSFGARKDANVQRKQKIKRIAVVRPRF